MTLLGIASLVGLTALDRPAMAEIHEESAVSTSPGMVQVTIEYEADYFEGTRTLTVEIPEERLSERTIPVWPIGDDSVTFDSPVSRLTWAHYLVAATLGFMLGLVSLMTLRGYGYVPGDGEPGSMTPTGVREDRGFYWRT